MTRRILIVLLTLFGLASGANAATSVERQFSDWHLVRQTFTNGALSCQALQCSDGICGGTKYFLLVASKTYKYIFPEFNHGSRFAKGAKVSLSIGGRSFTLVNRVKDNFNFFDATSVKQIHAINKALITLAKSGGSRKFHVTDASGYKSTFSARDVDKAFGWISKHCGNPEP